MRNNIRLLRESAVLGVAAAAVSAMVLGIVLDHIDITRTDFQSFYNSALTWRTGAPARQDQFAFPNLNPPTLAVLLAPLTFLPFAVAFWSWTVIGAVLLGLSLKQVWDREQLSLSTRAWTVAAVILPMPALAAWTTGQITWLLVYPMTRAWNASTRWRAGAWLAPVIAIKPPLALMAVLLPWPVPLAAAAGSAGLTIACVSLTGLARWRDWLALSGRVQWLGGTLNASLWGWAARSRSASIVATGLADIPSWQITLIVLIGTTLAIPVLRARSDRRWLFAAWWSLLMSPLGWVYYVPVALAPMVRCWQWNTMTMASTILFVLPVPAIALSRSWSWPVAWAINSTYAIALLLGWIGCAFNEPRADLTTSM